MKTNGFTLMEILVALTIFAILATITSAAMYNTFRTRTLVNQQADQLNQLQLTLILLENDSRQAVARPIRTNEMQLLPAFEGSNYYVEFTRDGVANPGFTEKRSTLKRIAYLCKGNQLIRRTWSELDPIDHNQYEERTLLAHLKHCQFEFLNPQLQVLNEWRAKSLGRNQKKESFPKAIKVSIDINGWGKSSMLFLIAKELYR